MPVTVRIASRQIARSWRQGVLIVLLIALPMTALSALAVISASMQPTIAEELRYTLGVAEASITVVSQPDPSLTQNPTQPTSFQFDTDEQGDPVHSKAGDPWESPLAVLPKSTPVIAITDSELLADSTNGTVRLTAVSGRSWDPSLRGRFTVAAGRAPASNAEVLVTRHALSRLGLTLGDTLTLQDPRRTVTVVGVMQQADQDDSFDALYGSAATIGVSASRPPLDATVFYLPTTALDWPAVQKLNRHGMIVYSRALQLNPPPEGTYTVPTYSTDTFLSTFAGFGGVIAALTIFEVGLLAGAAFAVSARSSQRSLATIASVGSSRGAVFRIVTMQGVLLGAVGGVIGVALGIAGGAIAMRLLDNGSSTRFPGFHLPWVTLVAIVAFAVFAGWLAAIVPAWNASRVDVVRALRGARRPTAVGKVMPIVGLCVVALGLAVSALAIVLEHLAVDRDGNYDSSQVGAILFVAFGGLVLLIVGLIFCSPVIIELLVRMLGHRSLSARLAGRDTSRNRARSVPVIAAIMATAAAASVAITITGSYAAQDAATYVGTAQNGQISVQLPSSWGYTYSERHTSDDPTRGVGSPDPAVTALTTAMPGADIRVIRGLATPSLEQVAGSGTGTSAQGTATQGTATQGTATQGIPKQRLSLAFTTTLTPATSRCPAEIKPYTKAWTEDARCRSDELLNSVSYTMRVIVGSSADLAAISGHPVSAEAAAALAHGSPVVFTPLLLDSKGTLRMATWPKGREQNRSFENSRRYQSTGIEPASSFGQPSASYEWQSTVVATRNPIGFGVFMTPATAMKMHVDVKPLEVLASPGAGSAALNSNDRDRAWQGLQAAYPKADAYTVRPVLESGPDQGWRTALLVALAITAAIALGTTAIALALARSDGRADEATLASVGASGPIRRRISFWQAFFITGIATVLGSAVGLVPAYVYFAAPFNPVMSVPWALLALVAFGIPCIAACAAFTLTRSRLRYRGGTAIA